LVHQQFFPAYAESPIKIHLNEEYGYWIEFPVSWFFDDTLILIEPTPGQNSGAQILATMHDGVNFWNHFASVTLILDDHIAMEHQGQDFIDKLIEELQTSCESSTFGLPGYECVNYNILSTDNFIVNGSQAYYIQEQWTELYPDGTNSSKISSVTNIVVGHDVWQIDTISDADEYPDNAQDIDAIPKSFKFVKTQKVDTPSPEIPEWIKQNAGWWATGQIDDDSFIQGIEYLITEQIIHVPSTETDEQLTNEIPEWIKNSAGWWANGIVSDSEFVNSLTFLIKIGVITVTV